MILQQIKSYNLSKKQVEENKVHEKSNGWKDLRKGPGENVAVCKLAKARLAGSCLVIKEHDGVGVRK